MPTILPTPQTVPGNAYYGGALTGGLGRLLLDAILAVQLAPRQQGSYTSPTGAQTQSSPAEVARGNAPLDQLLRSSQNRPAGAGYKPMGGLEFLPPLTRQVQQAQLQQAQATMAREPLEIEALKRKAARESAYTDYLKSQSSPASPTSPTGNGTGARPQDFSGIASPLVQQMAQSASSGDSTALDRLRRLAIDLDDEDAIAALQSLGEL